MKNLEKLVESIGNSDKKAQAWTNGQFGYGIYSFIAACDSTMLFQNTKESQRVRYL